MYTSSSKDREPKTRERDKKMYAATISQQGNFSKDPLSVKNHRFDTYKTKKLKQQAETTS
jgi:hypothetical protein